jgi:hypothetical protein
MHWEYAHLRDKAVELRSKHQMTLSEIVERLQLPKTIVYYWVKDIPVERKRRTGLNSIVRNDSAPNADVG